MSKSKMDCKSCSQKSSCMDVDKQVSTEFAKELSPKMKKSSKENCKDC